MGGGAEDGTTAVLLDFDDTEIEQIADNVLPFRYRCTVGGQCAAPMWPRIAASVRWNTGRVARAGSLLQKKLCSTRQQIPVAQHHCQRRQFHVGLQHKHTVE